MKPAPRWTFRLPDERRVGARRPAIANGTAHIAFMYEKGGASSSTLFALDLETGSERWSRTMEHVGNEPVAADGGVYWSGFDGSVRALDPQGRTRWESPHTDASLGVPISGNGDRLFVAEIAGGSAHTWCLDRATGRTLWRFAHGGHTYRLDHADAHVFHSAVSGGEPGVPTRSVLYALRAADGHVEWSVPSRDYLFNPIVHESRLSVASSRHLLLFDAARGRPLAEIELGRENATHLLSPSSLPDRPVVWHDSAGQGTDSIAMFSATGLKRLFGGERWELNRVWRVEEPRCLCEPPIALSEDRLIYLTHDGTLCTIARATGARLSEARLKTKPSPFGGLAVSGAQVIVAHGRDAFALDGI